MRLTRLSPAYVSIFSACCSLLSCAPEKVTMTAASSPSEPFAFACPAEGTQTRRLGSNVIITWHKPSDADLVACPATDQNGKEDRWLYGWYRLPTQEEQKKRMVIATALSSAQEDNCFNEILKPLNSFGSSVDFNSSYVYDYCWRLGPRKQIDVLGRHINAASLILTEEGRAGNTFAADRTIYYDLDTKAIVEVDVNMRRGNPVSGYKVAILNKVSK